jgi:hypothetical protein
MIKNITFYAGAKLMINNDRNCHIGQVYVCCETALMEHISGMGEQVKL